PGRVSEGRTQTRYGGPAWTVLAPEAALGGRRRAAHRADRGAGVPRTRLALRPAPRASELHRCIERDPLVRGPAFHEYVAIAGRAHRRRCRPDGHARGLRGRE